MADYRFSAKVIKRSNGQSAVAAAAYRAASTLRDERTGQTCDYSRKQGVTHSEVMTPKGTPDWMHDRAQLWNAVEAVERRKDAQLAREIQLSLPQELTNDQRRDLVRGFVQEQFVGKGMIADLAIHAPSAEGDQRNHHAHVMLTMRTLTGDGFGNKARDWNSPDQLQEWREQWAHHQNRELERHGHPARVDHRSFEAQGVDREPTQHLGPVASDMERNGKKSRIGDENRETANDNTARARDHMEAVDLAHQIEREKQRLGQWAEMKRRELDNAQDLSKLDLAQKHDRQKANLDSELKERHGVARATIAAELQAIEKRLQASGFKKVLRTVFGKTRADVTDQQAMAKTLSNIEQREREARQALEQRQQAERRKDARRMAKNKARLEKGVRTATERRKAEGWKPTTPRRRTDPERPPETPQATPTASPAPSLGERAARALKPLTARLKRDAPPEAKPTPPPAVSKRKRTAKITQPEVKPSDAPTLADEKRATGHSLDDFKGDAKRPWDSAAFSNDNARRPWDSDLSRSNDGEGQSRERAPSRGKAAPE